MIFVEAGQTRFPALPRRCEYRELLMPLAGSTMMQVDASISGYHGDVVFGTRRLRRIGQCQVAARDVASPRFGYVAQRVALGEVMSLKDCVGTANFID